MLTIAAVLIGLTGVAHSYLGERFILIPLFRRPLPKLFGDDVFTRQTLRFAWHVTTVTWWGIAALLLVNAEPAQTSLRILSATAFVSFLVALVGSRGKHLSWVVFLAVAVLVWMAAGSA
ncbi:MAG: hypothetical protein HKN29_09355 [Rhodothermales bacterium]|nr:hypothetical protein [Rhodothermales bacterium]